MNSSRREFFKQALGVVGAAVAAPAFLRTLLPSVAQAQAPGSFVTPGQGMAASVNYVEAAGKTKIADATLKVDRNGVKFADQKCTNCVLFTKNPGDANGKCALFANQQVKSDSWCKSWSKKP